MSGRTKLVNSTTTPLNPPVPGQYVGLVVFRQGRIIGFAVGYFEGGDLRKFKPTAWRGEQRQEDDVVTAWRHLTAGEMVYCSAFKVDGPDHRGKFLANYFPPAVN